MTAIRAGSQASEPYRPVLLVMLGESNAGGQVATSGLSSTEKAVTPEVQILDPVNFDFESLDIETNNNRDHYNLTPLVNVGWHTQIGNRMRAGTFVEAPLYLVEAGQGGSTLSQWNSGGTYYTKFVNRMNAAISAIETAHGQSPTIIILYTHGINDAITGTTAAAFKTAAMELIGRIRTAYGATIPFLITELPAAFHANEAAYNTAITEIASEMSNVTVIDTTGAGLQDSYHWSKSGMDLIADRMMDYILTYIL